MQFFVLQQFFHHGHGLSLVVSLWEFTFYGALDFFKIYVFISRLELRLRRLRFDYIYFFLNGFHSFLIHNIHD